MLKRIFIFLNLLILFLSLPRDIYAFRSVGSISAWYFIRIFGLLTIIYWFILFIHSILYLIFGLKNKIGFSISYYQKIVLSFFSSISSSFLLIAYFLFLAILGPLRYSNIIFISLLIIILIASFYLLNLFLKLILLPKNIYISLFRGALVRAPIIWIIIPILVITLFTNIFAADVRINEGAIYLQPPIWDIWEKPYSPRDDLNIFVSLGVISLFMSFATSYLGRIWVLKNFPARKTIFP